MKNFDVRVLEASKGELGWLDAHALWMNGTVCYPFLERLFFPHLSVLVFLLRPSLFLPSVSSAHMP